MDIIPIVSAATSAAERSRATLAINFDNFLTLLTTQLSQQDPLDPLDSNEFVAQLVSFTGVEQAINTNANIEKLIDLIKVVQSASAVGYLGTTIEAKGDTAMLADGEATYVYSLPETVATTSIVITNDQGEVVYVGEGETAAGEHSFVWNGRNNAGLPQPDGTYRISLSARDAEDNVVPVTTKISGRVTGVESAEGGLVLVVNGATVPFDHVISVTEGGAP